MSGACDNDNNENDSFDEGTNFEVINEFEDDIDYNYLLMNSNKLIKYNKLSSVRNQVFQSKVKALLGKEIELYLDVKTRWNTAPIKLDPLIKTEAAI